MRTWLRVGIAAALISLTVWLLWPKSEGPATPVSSEESATPPTFAPVVVQAEAEGLTLTGVVRDAAGKPVPDAEVFLAAAGQQSLATLACGTCGEPLLTCHAHDTTLRIERLLSEGKGALEPGARTRADAQGRFRFEHLVGISFTVWGRAPGFGDGIRERAAPGEPVELFLPAVRSIAGQVRDDSGRPLVATIRATSRRVSRLMEAKTDAAGAFTVEGLGEGPFYVVASAQGYLPGVARLVEAGSAPIVLTLQAPRRLEVRLVSEGKPIDGTVRLSGDHLTRALPTREGLAVVTSLFPGGLLVSAESGDLSAPAQRVDLDGPMTRVTLTLERGGALSVTVVDEGEQPVPDPTVEVLTTGGELIERRSAKTGELVRFVPLAQGDYLVRASAAGHRAQNMPARVGRGETAVEVVLTRGTVISGRVIDEYGRAAPGVSVLITPTGDSILADGQGAFSTVVPSPGLYVLHAHHSDWGGGEVKVTAPKSDVVLSLDAKGTVQVTVTSGGRRVEGANAMLFHTEGNYRSDRPSGADGVVTLRGLPPDSYMVVATHPDYLPSERQPVVLADGQVIKLEAQLRAGAAITGKVIDQVGAPVAGVTVSAMPRGAESTVTSATGAFSIGPLRPGGTYGVRVLQRGFDQKESALAKAGGEPVTVVVQRQALFRGRVLSEGQPVRRFRVDEYEVTSVDGRFEVALPSSDEHVIVAIVAPGYEQLIDDRPNTPDLGDFILKRAAQVTGVVREGAGPVADAVVTCDVCEQSVLTGADGRFALERPPFQREFSVVAKKGRRSATRTVSVDASEGLELRLEPGVQLTGLVSLADGRPAAGVEISGVHVDRSEPVSVVTNADGTYALEVPAGIYRFVVALPARRLGSEPAAVITEITGPTARLDFGPTPGSASLSVRVAPQAGYALWLVRGSVAGLGNPPLELLRSTYAQVIYQPRVDLVSFSGLAPGAYTLVWASFHAESSGGPLAVPVTVPASGEVSLVR